MQTTGQPQGEQPIGMWDAERDHPWRAALLYGLTLLASLLASHWWPMGCAG